MTKIATESAMVESGFPQTNTEKMLAQIFQDVIGVENPGSQERFLDLGGNSLNLVEVMNQIKEKKGIAPNPRLFFDPEKSTIVELSKAIDLSRDN